MGRKRLNRTKEELDELNRKRLRKFYEKHKDEIRRKNLKRYYNKIGKKMSKV